MITSSVDSFNILIIKCTQYMNNMMNCYVYDNNDPYNFMETYYYLLLPQERHYNQHSKIAIKYDRK